MDERSLDMPALTVDTPTQRIFTCPNNKKAHVNMAIRHDYLCRVHWDEDYNGQQIIIQTEYLDIDTLLPVEDEYIHPYCGVCNIPLVGNNVFARLSEVEHPCDFRCMYATGSTCVCSCGGPNHGKGWLK